MPSDQWATARSEAAADLSEALWLDTTRIIVHWAIFATALVLL